MSNRLAGVLRQGGIERRCSSRRTSLTLVLTVLASLAGLMSGARFARADAIVTSREVAQLVRLEEVDELNGEIFGYVANYSDQYIFRVNLLIRYHWHWRNELRPGEDDESRHETLTLSEIIPPKGRVRFSHRSSAPLPERADGELLPTVSIQSVQAYARRQDTPRADPGAAAPGATREPATLRVDEPAPANEF